MMRLAALVTLGCLAAFGQDIINNGPSAAGFSKSVHFGGQPGMSTPVTGAPYSGEVGTEHLQTLADGTHIRVAMIPTKVYRDSSGRTREERPLFGGSADKAPSGAESLMIIEISDPVARVRYVLDSQAKVAHKQALFVPECTASRSAGAGVGRPQVAPLMDRP